MAEIESDYRDLRLLHLPQVLSIIPASKYRAIPNCHASFYNVSNIPHIFPKTISVCSKMRDIAVKVFGEVWL